MTKVQQALAAVKQIFSAMDTPPAPPAEPPVPVALSDYKLLDGTVIQATNLEVGGTVTINDGPAPAGEYALEDGTMITVGEVGAITAVTPPPSADPAADIAAQVQQAMEKVTAEFEAKLKAQADGDTKKIEALQAENKAIKALFSKTLELVEAIASEDAEPPAGERKTTFKKAEPAPTDRKAWLKELSAGFNKITQQ